MTIDGQWVSEDSDEPAGCPVGELPEKPRNGDEVVLSCGCRYVYEAAR